MLRMMHKLGEDVKHGQGASRFKPSAAVHRPILVVTVREHRGHSRIPRDLASGRGSWRCDPTPPVPAFFKKEILPSLAPCSISSIVEAAGLSRVMCSKIRRGVQMPHARHWEALHKLGRGKEMVRAD